MHAYIDVMPRFNICMGALALGFFIMSATSICYASPAPNPRHKLNPDTLIFACTPYYGEGLMRDEFEPMMAYLSKKLGKEVKLKLVDSYDEMIALMNSTKVHLAVLSPLSYVRAKKAQPRLHLLASQIANGASTYSAYVIARRADQFTSLKALKGKRFGFVDRHSTSGYLYPMANFAAAGIVPETYFSEVLFAGDHEKLVSWVASGHVDAGATSSSAFNMMRIDAKGGPRLAIVAKSGRIPYDAVVANPRLAPSLVESARSAILELSTRGKEGRKILQGPTQINGFVPATDGLYSDIRRVLQDLGE